MSSLPEPPRGRNHIQAPPPFAPPFRQQLPRQEYGPPYPVYGPPPPPQSDITKSVFIHIPPEENEYPSTPQVLSVQPPKKHYKIIFIKAPEHPKATTPIIPPQPQDEHKTLVYVLVKQPEQQPQIELPIPETTQPTKPEVYFIKYKENKTPKPSYGPPTYLPPTTQTTPESNYGTPPLP